MGICSLTVADAPELKPLQVRKLPGFVIIYTLQQAGSMSEVVRARDREEFPYCFLCAVYIQVDLAENASVLKHRGCGGVRGGRKHLWKRVGNNVLSQAGTQLSWEMGSILRAKFGLIIPCLSLGSTGG